MSQRDKIAFVVQRYGMEVNGGAELYCRLLAERLNDYYNIEILTTCAIDYVTWQDEYKPGVEQINGITVRRFPVEKPRETKAFNRIFEQIISGEKNSILDQIEWMKEQGPFSLKLLEFLDQFESMYKVVIFITYHYFTTYFGIQLVPNKSVFVPTAHDDSTIRLPIYRSLFQLPRAIIYLTESEKRLVTDIFQNQHIKSVTAGIGVDAPGNVDPERFQEKYNIKEPYIVYIGRIEPSKGCTELFDYFMRWKKNTGTSLKLLLMGKEVMPVSTHPDIVSLGFVSDQDKFDGLAGAQFLVMPSPYESLSIVLLEAFYLGKPVLVNGKCEVLKDHCLNSNGGLYYNSYYEFEETMNYLLSSEEARKKMGELGQLYVVENYAWEKIVERVRSVIETNCYLD